MRKLFYSIILFSGFAFAQPTQRSVVLTWQSANPAGTVFNVYRGTATGVTCPTVLTKITTTPVPQMTYTDLTVVGGNTYCYAATAVSGTLESAMSINALAVLTPGPLPPTGLTATVITTTVTVTNQVVVTPKP